MPDCRSADVSSVGEPASDWTDHYELLGVSRDASVEEIILGYRLLVRTMLAHPELTGDDWNLGLAEHAFHTLSHADLRADYDRWLAEAEGRPLRVAQPSGYPPAPSTVFEPLVPRSLLPGSVPQRVAPPVLSPANALAEPADTPCESCAEAVAFSSSEPTVEERRALLRLRREGSIRGRLTDGRTFVASLHDVSPKGLGFETTLPLEIGAELWLKSDALFAIAVVRNRRVSPRDPAQHVVGVEFRRVHFRNARGTFLSTTA